MGFCGTEYANFYAFNHLPRIFIAKCLDKRARLAVLLMASRCTPMK